MQFQIVNQMTKKETKSLNRKKMGNKTRSEQLKAKSYRKHT
jgi:hypothetical protein